MVIKLLKYFDFFYKYKNRMLQGASLLPFSRLNWQGLCKKIKGV